ncbi:MAG: hypothetical protein ACRDN9_21340 [Streptosporangiaceae bacterium]
MGVTLLAAWFGVGLLILLVMVVFFVRGGAPDGGTGRRRAADRERAWRGTVRTLPERSRRALQDATAEADVEVGADVRIRVGDEAVEVFARRVGAGGVCRDCGLSFGGRRVSVCAYPVAGGVGHMGQPILLVASHADCRSSRWADEPDAVAEAAGFTGQAAATVLTVPMGVPLHLPRQLEGMWPGWFADRVMPLLLGGPPREAMLVHVQSSGAGVTADADLHRALGFATLPETAGRPLPAVGLADLTDLLAFWPTLRVTVGEGEETLAAGVPPRLARLVRIRRGALVAVTAGDDLTAGPLDPAGIRDGLASGRFLVGWASMDGPSTHAPRIGDLGAPVPKASGYLNVR